MFALIKCRHFSRNHEGDAHAPMSVALTSQRWGFWLAYAPSTPSSAPPTPSLLRRQSPHPISRRTSMSEHIHHVTDDTFEPEVLQADKPVLVDYWAEWCGPCKMIAPLLDEVAKDYAGKLKVAKLNIDENQATPPKYGIRGI